MGPEANTNDTAGQQTENIAAQEYARLSNENRTTALDMSVPTGESNTGTPETASAEVLQIVSDAYSQTATSLSETAASIPTTEEINRELAAQPVTAGSETSVALAPPMEHLLPENNTNPGLAILSFNQLKTLADEVKDIASNHYLAYQEGHGATGVSDGKSPEASLVSKFENIAATLSTKLDQGEQVLQKLNDDIDALSDKNVANMLKQKFETVGQNWVKSREDIDAQVARMKQLNVQ